MYVCKNERAFSCSSMLETEAPFEHCQHNHFQQVSSTRSNLAWQTIRFLAKAGNSLERRSQTSFAIFPNVSDVRLCNFETLTNNCLRTSLLKSMHNLQLRPQGKDNSLSFVRNCCRRHLALTQQLVPHLRCPVEGRARIWGVRIRED